MKICIDEIGLNFTGTGLFSYTSNLIEMLLSSYPHPEYYLIEDKWVNSLTDENSKYSGKLNSLNINRKENFNLLYNSLEENKVNIFHSLNNGFSMSTKKQNLFQVATLHELLPIISPELVDDSYLRKFKSSIKNVIANADKIIAVSETIKTDFQSYFNIPDDKISVAYPVCSNVFFKTDYQKSMQYIKNTFSVVDNFILFAGSIHPRKNLETAIKAFWQISKKDANICFVIAGKTDGKRKPYVTKLKNLTRELNIENKVIFTGIVTQVDLCHLYNACKCVVDLSCYEGFPLTLVESLACQRGVLCNKTPINYEVINKFGAILIDISDINQVTHYLNKLIYENYAYISPGMSKALKEKYSTFQFEKNTIRIYEQLIYK